MLSRFLLSINLKIIFMQKGANKAVVYFLLAVLPIMFLVSCAHTPNITGTWQEPGKRSSIEFGQDGTFTAVDDMGMTVSGNYTLQAKGKIRFEIKHPDSSVEIIRGNITVQDDELLFTFDEDKEVLTYIKAH
jgi:outer membrane lipoprotein-sorting protein